MRIKDARAGLRVKTPDGLGSVIRTVKSVLNKQYIVVEVDNRIPGRKDMSDRRCSYSARSVSPATETADQTEK